MEVLQTPPSASSFTPLAEHQSRTPESFYDGPPVLHFQSSRCKVIILESDLVASSALNALRGGSFSVDRPTGTEGTEGKEIVIEDVDVFVTSDKFLLYRTEANSGVALPYPLISLHAIQRFPLPGTSADEYEAQGLYMQIAKPRSADEMGSDDDEEEDSIILTIVPPPVGEAASAALGSSSSGTETAAIVADEITTEANADTKPEETATQALFAAVSACSNLHPDPVLHDEEEEDDYDEQAGVGGILQAGLAMPGAADGGLPPPVNGSSGWITADNMHEYFDEDGNWIADGEPPASMGLSGLGPGAGNVHSRDEDNDGEVQNGNDIAEENGDGEAKWRRTD